VDGVSAPPPASANRRREAILAAALDLFRGRGFHSVGVDEIGTAAGISGPGVYRHFPGKGSLLVALFDSITDRLLRGAEEIQKSDCSPPEMLDRLVSFHAVTAVEERAMVAVWLQDWRSLPEADQQRLWRRQAEYLAIWQTTLTRVRPDLGPGAAETLVQAAVGAINSVAVYDAGLEPPELTERLSDAAGAVLRTA
jgi:AcrR family transcriptional regulator